MSKKPRFPPKTRNILFAVFPDFQILDLTGPMTAFEMAARFKPNAYAARVVSVAGGAITSSGGLAISSESLKGARLAHVDTFIIVGGRGIMHATYDAALIAALKRAHAQTRRVASVCSGAFPLAAAGLLDGKRATTHWNSAAALQKHFPKVRVEADSIYVREGKVWTSAGITAGIDLALAMIGADLGPDIAKEVARHMVVYAQRPGGQTQHSTLLELDQPASRFAKLNTWMREHLAEDLSVERLAAHVAMSPRNFARAYAHDTGVTPAKAVERLRLEAARAALEDGAAIQDIAVRTGFGDNERMRRAFVRTFGAPPAQLRRTLRRA